VKAVIPIDEGVAVVAETFPDAQRGLLAVNVEWNDEHAERRSSEELLDEDRRLLETGEQAVAARSDATSTTAFSNSRRRTTY
jgi:isoquinoline 1-oxidoreductase subunit beta